MAHSSQAEAKDGTVLSYHITGTGPRRFALIHSLAMDGSFWDRTVGQLGSDTSVLSWDCRGHGASGKPSGPYGADLFADDLAAVLDAAGWDSATVAGASMGGCVALAFAQRHPGRCKALGLFDTTASYGPTAPEDWEDRAAKARESGLSALVGFQKTRWFSDAFREAHPEIVARCVDIFCANDIDAYVATCRMLGRVDLTGGLGKMRMPVSILVGEEDYATPPAFAQALHEAIPGSTLEVIAAARHLTPVECPELVAHRLDELERRTGQ